MQRHEGVHEGEEFKRADVTESSAVAIAIHGAGLAALVAGRASSGIAGIDRLAPWEQREMPPTRYPGIGEGV
jgi:hypothetical protein